LRYRIFLWQRQTDALISGPAFSTVLFLGEQMTHHVLMSIGCSNSDLFRIRGWTSILSTLGKIAETAFPESWVAWSVLDFFSLGGTQRWDGLICLGSSFLFDSTSGMSIGPFDCCINEEKRHGTWEFSGLIPLPVWLVRSLGNRDESRMTREGGGRPFLLFW
jgi:hypothetical protein